MGVTGGISKEGDFDAAAEEGGAVAAIVLVVRLLDRTVALPGEVDQSVTQPLRIVAPLLHNFMVRWS